MTPMGAITPMGALARMITVIDERDCVWGAIVSVYIVYSVYIGYTRYRILLLL